MKRERLARRQREGCEGGRTASRPGETQEPNLEKQKAEKVKVRQ